MSTWAGRTPTADEMRGILEAHSRWLRGDGGTRANLSGANLYGANLSGANLYGANLSSANLSSANLSSADLSSANLSSANLSSANLSGANLSGANLSGADLYGADLSRANLSGANLSGANLSGADLYGANLYVANLYGADLSDADLSRANLSGANLYGANLYGADLYVADLSRANLSGAKNAELTIARTRILPAGDLVGWKQCRDGIVMLRIPAEAKRSHAFGRKCRSEYAEVLETPNGAPTYSLHDPAFRYAVGETVRPAEWCDDWTQECAGGIHFYITREEAEAHS